jgi:adenylate cyclase
VSEEAPESQEGQPPNKPPAAAEPPPSGTNDGAPHSSRHAHGHHPAIAFRFLDQLKHRNVIRAGILYLVVCWLILDPVHVLFHMLDVPVWANRLVVILMAVGFPAVLLFAWVYEITPEGFKPTADVDPRRSIRTQTGQRLNYAIVVVLVLALTYFVVDKFWISKHALSVEGEKALNAPATAPLPAIISDKSIAVLPFADMSEKKDQEYFADGMAEEIIDLLVKIPGLKVIARTSSFQFKGQSQDLRTIGTQLGVAYVLEGSVRKSGDRLRVTAQLIDSRDGTHLFSQTYDRDLSDVLKMQDEIAAQVVRALQIEVNGWGPRPALRNAEAYTQYLQGMHAFDRFDQQGFEQAASDFQRALDLDPSFAEAAAALAWVSEAFAEFEFRPLAVAFEQARHAAQHAIELNPNLAIAHAALGRIQLEYDWDWPAADREVKRARGLAPNDSLIMMVAAQQSLILGRLDDALMLVNASLERDPLDPGLYFVLNWIQVRRGRLAEAEAAVRRTLEISPTYNYAHYYLGIVLLTRGQPEAALAEFLRETVDWVRVGGSAMAYFALGRKAESDAALAQLLMRQDVANHPYNMAQIYGFRGESDEALKWLDRAYASKSTGLYHIKGDPPFKNLEDDPRYQALLRKMNLLE